MPTKKDDAEQDIPPADTEDATSIPEDGEGIDAPTSNDVGEQTLTKVDYTEPTEDTDET